MQWRWICQQLRAVLAESRLRLQQSALSSQHKQQVRLLGRELCQQIASANRDAGRGFGPQVLQQLWAKRALLTECQNRQQASQGGPPACPRPAAALVAFMLILAACMIS